MRCSWPFSVTVWNRQFAGLELMVIMSDIGSFLISRSSLIAFAVDALIDSIRNVFDACEFL